jgi:hypothetical protein
VKTVKSKGFRLSRIKTEYMRCQFRDDNSDDEDVSLAEQIVPMKDTFQYLRLML